MRVDRPNETNTSFGAAVPKCGFHLDARREAGACRQVLLRITRVNPTPDREYTYTLPRAYKNWDGEVVPQGTTLTIRPRTGVALYAAPEIVLEITPQQITALPGEIVTFQVRCRNQGLQSGTNLQVSVPLPDGVEFISASDGGQYSNRQVRWTLPRLDTGQTRTLTFQARIQ
jgi:uncharacterized repeat protein (TIGR01451 family)